MAPIFTAANAQRLYLFGVIAENAVLPWLSSGREIDSENRRIQNAAAASTVLAGEVASNHITNPGAALKSIASKEVKGLDAFDQPAFGAATRSAGIVDQEIVFWFGALKAALFLFFVPVEYLNGMGQTHSGAKEFVEGQKRFLIGISTLLGHANPDPDRWSGEAADNYQTHNAYQQSRVNKMVDADSRVVALLHEQGDEVEAARRQLAAVRLAVTGAIAVASVMLTAYVRIRRESYTNLFLYKKAEAMGWALVRFIQASLLGMAGNVIDVITNLGIRGTKTKNRINNVIGDYYRWVINDWHKHQLTGVAIGPTRTAAPATALPGFTDLLDAQSAAAASANEADAATGSRQRLPESAFAATPVITGLDQRRVSSPHALQRPSPRRLGQGHEADSAEGQAQQPTPAAPQPAAPAIPVLGAEGAAPVGAATAAQT